MTARPLLVATLLIAHVAVSCSAHDHGEVQSGSENGTPQSTEPEICSIREAIVSTLNESTEPWATGLAERTLSASCNVLTDGSVRIGNWASMPCDGCDESMPIRFLWIESDGEVPTYAAEVERLGQGFQCIDLGQFLVPQADSTSAAQSPE